METSNAKKVADSDTKAIQGTSIGHAINMVMDFGNGRQITISGTLPLGATLKDFNNTLDMLRQATNRQQAYVTMRNREAQLAAGIKMLAMHEFMLEEHERQSNAQIKEFDNHPQKGNTVNKQHIQNLQQQFSHFKSNKLVEINQQKSENEVNEVIIASAKKEIEELDKLGA